MKKKLAGIIFFIIFLIILIFLICTNTYCTDKMHRESFPANPYCTKCHRIDGVIQHECTNPDGIDKYCSYCGKIVVN